MEGIIMPLVKYLASWLCALGPFALGLIYLVMFGQIDGRTAVEHFALALTGDFEAAFDPQKGGSLLLGGILLIAMMIWPMMVLVVAVGGIRSLTRFDLMMLTIVKSFPAYILVVLLAYAGIVGTALLMEAGLAAAGGGEEELRISAAVLAVGALLVVLEVYANIFTMRVIGLYYHHFKERFAWSWG